MEFARIADQEAAQFLRWLADEDICAAQREEDMAREAAEVDRLIDAVDRELAAEQWTQSYRITREFIDQRQARRAHRRAARLALRSLPTQLDALDTSRGDAA
jgi:hypothetical protein